MTAFPLTPLHAVADRVYGSLHIGPVKKPRTEVAEKKLDHTIGPRPELVE